VQCVIMLWEGLRCLVCLGPSRVDGQDLLATLTDRVVLYCKEVETAVKSTLFLEEGWDVLVPCELLGI
jgi:hypothetical protein